MENRDVETHRVRVSGDPQGFRKAGFPSDGPTQTESTAASSERGRLLQMSHSRGKVRPRR